jgi:hypothetical protein
MPSYGATPGFIDRIFSVFTNNEPLAISQVCAKLHKGAPGVGLTNSSQVTQRAQVNFSSPSGGHTGLGGGAPTFNVELDDPDTETIQAISLWTGFEGDVDAYCMMTAAANSPVTVATGDVVILNLCDIDADGLAS